MKNYNLSVWRGEGHVQTCCEGHKTELIKLLTPDGFDGAPVIWIERMRSPIGGGAFFVFKQIHVSNLNFDWFEEFFLYYCWIADGSELPSDLHTDYGELYRQQQA